HLNQPAPRPSAKLSEIPVALDKLIVQLMAKDPTDRPWDAAAVAVSLTEIREKASRGETLAMVWPGGAVPPGETIATGLETTRTTPSKKKKGKANHRFFEVPDRSKVELILLLIGLVSIGGFLGYMLWPPSEEYLFRQAEVLMEKDKLHDWITAREKYLDPLDHRFETNPYRKTTKGWRDRIALTEAGTRAEILEGHLTRLNKPNGRAEEMYRAFFELADKSSREFDDESAVHHWRELAEKLEGAPEDRGWMLLAQKRAADLSRSIEQRGQLVRELLASAAKADQTNHPLEAARIRQTVLEKYKKYTDMVSVFEEAGLSLNPPDSQVPGREPAPSPAPKPEGSNATPSVESKTSTGTKPRD
ncbi:serine/threonine protein kinase, partial [Singulisphaera rosea]